MRQGRWRLAWKVMSNEGNHRQKSKTGIFSTMISGARKDEGEEYVHFLLANFIWNRPYFTKIESRKRDTKATNSELYFLSSSHSKPFSSLPLFRWFFSFKRENSSISFTPQYRVFPSNWLLKNRHYSKMEQHRNITKINLCTVFTPVLCSKAENLSNKLFWP